MPLPIIKTTDLFIMLILLVLCSWYTKLRKINAKWQLLLIIILEKKKTESNVKKSFKSVFSFWLKDLLKTSYFHLPRTFVHTFPATIAQRFATFRRLTNCNISFEKLAHAGFYYTGENHTVKCDCCGSIRPISGFHAHSLPSSSEFHNIGCIYINASNEVSTPEDSISYPDVQDTIVALSNSIKSKWHKSPKPIDITYERCLMTFGNMVIFSSADPRFSPHVLAHFGFYLSIVAQKQYLICRNCKVILAICDNIFELHIQVSPQCCHHEESDSSITNHHLQEIYETSECPPHYPEFAEFRERVDSFNNGHWMQLTSHQLADAGFFYLGTVGRVCCFFCGGHLHEARSEASVREEHASWFPRCPYSLRQMHLRELEASQQSVPNSASNSTALIPNNLSTSLVPSTTQARQSSGLDDSTLLEPSQQAGASASKAPAPSTPEQGAATEKASNTSNSQTTNQHRGPTYAELGIITERPKRPEYTVKLKRQESFDDWPRNHPMTIQELVEAGFYYAGYGDCVSCFYCGGGLRRWEDGDDALVEHARWFPNCGFVRQQMGLVFVDVVQQLRKYFDQIPMQMVQKKLKETYKSCYQEPTEEYFKRYPAFRAVGAMGCSIKDAITAAKTVRQKQATITADVIFDWLAENCRPRDTTETPQATASIVSSNISQDLERLKAIKEQNNQLRQQTVCKICMDQVVAVVFLPCGHLVSCSDCASITKCCPICLNQIKGCVRAFLM